MNDYFDFEPSNIIYTKELKFDEKHLRQRWHRVKEQFSYDDNEHWQKALRDVKAILGGSKMYPWP